MPFEWDLTKNAANIAKHGVSFEVASLIFKGFVLTRPDARIDYREARLVSIGKVGAMVFLAVVHTDREGNVRLISARPANRAERKRYDDALQEGSHGRGTGDPARQ